MRLYYRVFKVDCLKRLLPILLFFCSLPALRGQTSAGTDFWLTSMVNWVGSDSFFVIVSAEKSTKATIDIPRLGFTQNLSLNFNDLQRVYIPSGYKPGIIDSIYECGIHVTSDLPVSVYTLSAQSATTDASCIFPTAVQPPGGTFYISNPPVYNVGYNRKNSAAIVAIDDSLQVEITPSVTTSSGRSGGNKYIVRMRKGQVYMFTASGKVGLEGSLIKASAGKRIAVFSGDECVAVRCGACDHVYEEIPPTTVLGKNFVITPFLNQNKGYDYQVVAMDAGTRVEENGVLLTILNAGQTYYRKVWGDSSFCISASKPIMLVQYMTGISCQSPRGGDPAMLVINPLEQTISYAMVATSNTTLVKTHFMTIAVPKSGLDSVYLDGALLNRTDFDTVSCGNYFFYRTSVAAGNHRIQCRFGFICYLYGIGSAESYAYSAGMGMRNLQRYIISESFPGCDSGFIVKLSSKGDSATAFRWLFNNSQTDTVSNPFFYVSKPGVYPVKLRYKTLGKNFWDSTITDVLVEKPLYSDFITFTNRVVCDTAYTLSLPNAPVFTYLWNTGATTPTIRVKQNGKYKVRITNTKTGCIAYDSCNLTFQNAIKAKFGHYMTKFCPGIPLYLYDSSRVNGDTISAYRWYADGYLKSSNKNDTIKSPRANNYEVKLVISTVKGCMDSTVKSILISDFPQARAGVTRYDSCFGTNLFRFNNGSTTNVGRITRLKWIFSDGDTSNKLQPIKHFQDSGTHTFRLVAFSETGCIDTTDVLPVVVYPVPRTAMLITDSSVCLKGNYFEFKNNTPRDSRAQKFLWAFSDGTGTTFENPGRIPFDDTGTYQVKFVASFAATGCGDTARRIFRIYPDPDASMVVDSSNFCLNRNYYQVRSTSDRKGWPGEKLRWDWGDGTSTADTSPYRIRYTSAGTFRIRLIYETGKGCYDTAFKNVVVYNSPKASWMITDSNRCDKSNYFQISNTSVAPGNARWTWVFGDGNTSTVKSPGKLTYSKAGSYNAWLAVRDPLTGCTDTSRKLLRVFQFPALKLRVSDTARCFVGDTFVFRDSTPYGVSASRLWQFPDKTDTAMVISRTFPAAGFHQVRLIGGIPGICADTTAVTVRIRYNGNPLKASQRTDSKCAPAKADLLATGGNTSWTYNWLDVVNNRTLTGDNVSGILFGQSGRYPLLLTATDPAGCVFKASDTITLYDGPRLSISHINADKQCLKNNVFALTGSVLGGSAPFSISWDLDEGKTASGMAVTPYSYSNPGSKNIRAVIEDQNKCKDTSFSSAMVYQGPGSRISSDSGCTGNILRLVQQNDLPANRISRVSWLLNNSEVFRGSPYLHLLGAPGMYQLRVVTTSTDNCTDTSLTVQIRSLPKPVAKFGLQQGTASALGVPVTFTDSSTGATAWEWKTSDNNYGYSNSFYYLYPFTGETTMRLIVKNSDGCADTAFRIFILESGDDGWVPTAFTPNGSGLNDRFLVSGLSAVTSYRMIVFNRWGEKVYESTRPEEGWDGTYKGQPAMEGSYSYIISVVYFNGKRRVFNGEVTLLR